VTPNEGRIERPQPRDAGDRDDAGEVEFPCGERGLDPLADGRGRAVKLLPNGANKHNAVAERSE
jgi:hypothetical protein